MHLDAWLEGEPGAAGRRRRARRRTRGSSSATCRRSRSGCAGSCARRSTSTGAPIDLHSGSYGGAVHNPINALCEIVAALKGPDGRIRVPGFYDDVVPLTDADRAALRRAAVRRGGVPGQGRRPGARRRGGVHDPRARGRPSDARRERDLGRVPGRGHQDDHPGPRARQGQLPARGRPGPGPDLRARARPRPWRSRRPGVTVSVRRSAAAGRASSRSTIRRRRPPRGRSRRRSGCRRSTCARAGRSRSRRAFGRIVGLPVVLLGFAHADGQAHAPNESMALDNYERRDPGDRCRVLGRARRADADLTCADPLARAAGTGPVRRGPPARSRDRPGAATDDEAAGRTMSADATGRPTARPASGRGGSTTDAGAWRPARRSTSSWTSTTSVATARSASTRPCRSGSRRSTRRSGRGCGRASSCSSAAPRGPARRRWPSRWRATSLPRPGQRPLPLLRARRAVPAQPARSRSSRPSPTCRRRPARSRSRTSARRSSARGWSRARERRAARRQPAPPADARPDRALRAEPVPAPRLADGEHDREHPPARPPAPGDLGGPPAHASSSTTCRRCRRSPSPPTESEKVTYVGERPQGHRAVRGGADRSPSSPPTRRASRRRASATTTCAARRPSTTRPTSSSSSTRSTTSSPRSNIEFNPYQAQRFRDWVIATVEKNRGGQDNVDLEFEKHFEYSCFDPNGRAVQEKLIEERLYND